MPDFEFEVVISEIEFTIAYPLIEFEVDSSASPEFEFAGES